MPRTKEQFDNLRSQKIALIENTAMECFAAKGFHSTSINFIAKKAGISTGLTYNYFPSKDELLKSIYLKGIKKIFVPIEKLKAINEADFFNFIEHIFNEIACNTQFWKLYFIVISQPDVLSKYQDYMMEMLAPVMTRMTSYFKKKGVPDPDVEARLLFSALDGICLNYLIDSEHYPLIKIKKKFLQYYEQ